MNRVALWWIAVAAFLVAAVATALSDQWALAAASVALAASMGVLAMREARPRR
ncbi:hypothetical protein [Clavibacter sp. VKM Ac-2872]|uniref:hypothetical protein n=1 Tax=Clavibacter sp. VKM Ac-2872 TaxID=2783812 RepID=UPI00188BE4A5|nr:hypothetical protein [Clavibacter sp. VKM Ac-2872]MBF4623217.1 hypothetical protein [Clavibacter sp. VKM Ac-2872]